MKSLVSRGAPNNAPWRYVGGAEGVAMGAGVVRLRPATDRARRGRRGIVEFFFRLVAEFLRIVTAMKMIYKLALVLLVLLAVAGCMALYNMFFDVILEPKDVQTFKVQELRGTHPTRLQLSGLAFNSSMGVRKITTKRDGTAVVVLVHLSLAHRGASGNFAYELTIPDSVNEVRFGHSVTPVWKRGTPSSEVPSPPSTH